MEIKKVKIVVYSPIESAQIIRDTLAKSGAGHIGNYSHCSFSQDGIGRFKPLNQANPHLGQKGIIEQVKEERIEAICPYSIWEKVVNEIQKVHPYEEPAIDVIPLLN